LISTTMIAAIACAVPGVVQALRPAVITALSAQERVLLRDPKPRISFLGPHRDLRRPGRHAKLGRCVSRADPVLQAATASRFRAPSTSGAAARSLPAHRHRLVRPPPVRLRRRQTLDRIESATGRVTPDPRRPEAILQADRSELARLMLGVAMYASEEVPMKLQTRDTQIEMPGLPEALGIDATGDTFAARIAFDGASHLPVRLVFWSGDRTVLTTAFSDRRSAGGMKVPYRIVTTAGDRSVDELLFDEVAVNPPLSKGDFTR
jgi:hypothetical protein